MTTAEVKQLVERLEEEGRHLSGSSLNHGCASCGISANLADEAASALTLLSQERDGYRLALRRIADHNNAFLTDGSEATRKCIDHLVEIARAALKDT